MFIYILYIYKYIYIYIYIYLYIYINITYIHYAIFPIVVGKKKSSTVSDQIFQSLNKLPFMYFNKLAL